MRKLDRQGAGGGRGASPAGPCADSRAPWPARRRAARPDRAAAAARRAVAALQQAVGGAYGQAGALVGREPRRVDRRLASRLVGARRGQRLLEPARRQLGPTTGRRRHGQARQARARRPGLAREQPPEEPGTPTLRAVTLDRHPGERLRPLGRAAPKRERRGETRHLLRRAQPQTANPTTRSARIRRVPTAPSVRVGHTSPDTRGPPEHGRPDATGGFPRARALRDRGRRCPHPRECAPARRRSSCSGLGPRRGRAARTSRATDRCPP